MQRFSSSTSLLITMEARVGNLATLHHTAQQRRRPIGTQDVALREIGAGTLHRIPASGLGEQRFSEFSGHFPQYGSGRVPENN
ncbi:MAG: hypothetical protein WDN00_12515 [Limisphaerales bacterium]